jgi:branched-chain amino acid transport system substrate-binding protein
MGRIEMLDRRKVVGAGLGIFAAGKTRVSSAQDANAIKIGLITDMSGIYKDIEGPTSVACAKLAIREFTAVNPEINVELIVGDHQNRVDIGLGIIREWLDRRGVDVITDVGNSALALGARTIVEERNKVSIVTSAGSSDLTGKSCSTNQLQWSYDSWCLAHSTATAITQLGGKRWFFVTADYAFGHAAQKDATRFVEAAGGTVVGSVAHPLGASDYASFLLQAQAVKPDVIAFANAGADLINCMRQAQEFDIAASGIRLAAMVGLITDILGMGLPVAQGLSLTETFYWDLNDRTRAFMKRLQPSLPEGAFPNMAHVGNYSGLLHYLKAVKELGVTGAKASGRSTIDTMKKMATDDDCFGPGSIRADGRKIHPAYLFTAKDPSDSKRRGDVYKLLSTIPAEQAFRSINEGDCPIVKT